MSAHAPDGRTSVGATPLRDWARHPALTDLHVDSLPGWRPPVTFEEVTATGIAAADVRAFIGAALDRDPDEQEMTDFADALAVALVETSRAVPGLSVRAAIGWVLVGTVQGGLYASEAIAAWVGYDTSPAFQEDGGLGRALKESGADQAVEDGWVFAAAGIGLTEAEAQAQAGTLDGDLVAAMAALRGVPRPVTA